MYNADETIRARVVYAAGPRGERGPQGPVGPRGETGPRGEPGDGVRILGTYETAEALAAGVTGPAQGDMYNVGAEPPYTVYMWDTALAPPGWRELGKITSPPTVHVGPGEPRNGELVWVDTDAPATGTTGADIAVSAEDGRTVAEAVGALEAMAGEAGNRVRELTAAELTGLDAAARAALYAEGTRALKVINGETVTLHGVRGDGSLAWLGSNRPVVNLLDNGNFQQPVNQRAATGGTVEWLYTIDRWLISGTYAFSGGGLVLSPGTKIVQRGKNVTLNTSVYTAVCKTDKGYIFGSVYPTPAHDEVFFGNLSEETVTVSWAALYEGTYTVDTLPPYAPKGYAAELQECKRYYYAPNRSGSSIALAFGHTGWGTSSGCRLTLGVGTRMRANPTVIREGTDVSALVLYAGGKSYSVAAAPMSAAVFGGEAVALTIDASGLEIPVYQPCVLLGNGISFSADL